MVCAGGRLPAAIGIDEIKERADELRGNRGREGGL